VETGKKGKTKKTETKDIISRQAATIYATYEYILSK